MPKIQISDHRILAKNDFFFMFFARNFLALAVLDPEIGTFESARKEDFFVTKFSKKCKIVKKISDSLK